MIGLGPVERRALYQQDFFLQQQILHQLPIVLNVEHFGVEPGESLQRAFGFDAAHPGNGIEFFVSDIALGQQPAARKNQIVDRLVAT